MYQVMLSQHFYSTISSTNGPNI